MKTAHIGFTDSDKFLAAIDLSRPVNLSVTRHTGKSSKMGLAIDSTVLMLSQVVGDEVLYLETVVHHYQTIRGEIFDADKDKPARLAEQVLQIARQYLTERGVQFREALLSTPTNCTKMNGDALFLHYDKEAGYRYLTDADRTETAAA